VTQPEPERIKPRRFAYDVGINILANLFAAAIVYLLAIVGGYLKANPAVLLVAISIILGTLTTAFTIWLGARSARQELAAAQRQDATTRRVAKPTVERATETNGRSGRPRRSKSQR
jgi:hypothetical protein